MNNNSPNASNPARDAYHVDLLGLLRRKFTAILFFLICAVALAVLYYFQAPKTYESWAKVYIDDQRAPTMAVDGEVVEDSTVEKYIEIITSHAVLADAIEACDVDNMESLADEDDVLFYVRENLYAKPSDTRSLSGVMRLRFQSDVEDDCQVLLTNVLTSFDEFLRQGSEDQGSSRLETITKLESERKETFTNLMFEIEKLMQKPFIQVIDGKVYNQYQGQASKLQEELDINASERLRFVALRDNLVKARAQNLRIEDLVVDLIKDMNEGQLGGYTATHDKFLELKVLEKSMTGEFGSDHPDLQNVRQQIEMVDRMRKAQMISAIRNSIGSDVGGGDDFYSVVKSYVDNKIKFFDSHEEQLRTAINESKFKSLEIAKECEQLTRLIIERDMLAQGNVEMRDMAQEYNVLSNYSSQNVRIIDPASKAEQVAPDLLICLASGIFLGLISGFGFALLKELAEKTFRSSSDITRQLGVDVVAQIPKCEKRVDKNFKHLASDLVAIHQPQSQSTESIKALRTSLLFKSKNDKQLQVVQITSPTAGDGKSFVSSNLSIVMAQAGRNVLLIDCDLRRQTQHERFNLGNQVGVTSIISGECDLEGAVQPTEIKNLDLLASGPPCGNPAEILSSDDFADLLQEARKKYDFVIVDTPPVLPVTDPAIICNLVDAVYMPMRIRNGVQVKSQKAIEALAMVGCEITGVVINGLTKNEAGSYSYGGYGSNGYAKYGAYRQASPIEKDVRPSKGPANKGPNKSNGDGKGADSIKSYKSRN